MSSEKSDDNVRAEREKIFKLCFHSTAKAKDDGDKLFERKILNGQSLDIDDKTAMSICELKFLSSGINDVILPFFNKLSSLRFIDLSNNNIRELPKTIFYQKKCLEEVYFDNNRIKELDEDLFQGLEELRVVSFNSNLIAKLADKFLGVTISNNKNLCKLSFSSNLLQGLPYFFTANENVRIDFRENLNLFDLNNMYSLLFYEKRIKCDNLNDSYHLKVNEDKNQVKQTLFLLYFNRKVRVGNLLKEEEFFKKFNENESSLLDFLVCMDEDSVSDEFLLSLNSFIENELNTTLENEDFLIQSPDSVERLCQRNDIALVESMLHMDLGDELSKKKNRIKIEKKEDLGDEASKKKRIKGDLFEFYSKKEIKFETCFDNALKNENEEIAIHLLKIFEYLQDHNKSESLYGTKHNFWMLFIFCSHYVHEHIHGYFC
jgi:hypothetical protein